MALKFDEPLWFTPPPVRGRYQSGLWKDSPSPPSPPDPTAVANAQGAANTEAARITAALNRADQVTPYGNLTWSKGTGKWDEAGYNNAMKLYNEQMAGYNKALTDYNNRPPAQTPTNFEGGIYTGQPPDEGFKGVVPTAPNKQDFGFNPDSWTSTVTLDPRVQTLLDASLATSQGLQGAISKSLGTVTDTLGKPISAPSTVDIAGIRQGVEGRYTDLQPSLQGANTLAGMGRAGVADQLTRLQNLYKQDFNYDSAPAMPTADTATRQRVEDALYGRAVARLDPRFSQAQDKLNSSLAAQGITQGSEAYGREQQNFSNARNDAYSSALNDAISGSDTAMQRLFNMGLAARQQGVNEANTLRTLPTQEAAALSGINNALDAASRGWYGAETAQETAKDNSTVSQFNLERTNNQDQFNNTVALRNQILNELNALRTGAQAAMPQFSSTQSGAQVAPSPVAQSIYNSYQGQLGNYNTAVASNNQMMGGLASLGGAALMAPSGGWLAGLFG